ncbi:MAG: hypothetical protein H8E41_02775 [Desulfobulbaceae bacterium]|uniref:DUF5666 domain-containing protein n=1 Tax=Candidatus Desulfobia pelagia TaxID=2841692 RepID=A0A8J6NAU5_9BACT|nr:hypothetical protein [Candidatus Desulfobia pelagia]
MKKLITAATLAIFLLATSATGILAASAKCKVTAITDTIVTLDCGDNAEKLTVGTVVKVKTEKKKAIEGC